MSKVIEKPQLSFTEALKEARGKLLQFSGRSRRSEFWWCALAVVIGNFILNLIPIIGALIGLVLMLLMIPLTVRRLHDSGHSGWWLVTSIILSIIYSCLIGTALFAFATGESTSMSELMSAFSNPLVLIVWLLSFIIGIIILVFLLQDSKFAPNKYGVSPKYVTVDDDAAGAKAEQSDFDKGMEKVGDAIDNFAEAAQDKAEDLAGKAKDTASDLVDKAKDAAEKAKDSAGDFVDKAKDTAENLVDKAKDAAENVADKAKDITDDVVDKAKDLTEKAKDAID